MKKISHNWTLVFSRQALQDIRKLDKPIHKRIVKYLNNKAIVNPRQFGELLRGDLREYWKYRVGEYRIICELKDQHVEVLIIRVGHRREVYNLLKRHQ